MRLTMMVCSLCFAMLAGCATAPGERTATASTQPHAECLVCKKNADLACIDVEVDSTTPTSKVDGKTYYFCSKECRDKFAANPTKYLPK